MKKLIAAGMAALLAAGVLSACNGSNQVNEEVTPYPVTVGNVTVLKKPRAVASLSPSLTKILLDLGYQSEIVGYSGEDELPEGVELSDLTEQLAQAQGNGGEIPEEEPEGGESVPETSSVSEGEPVSSESETESLPSGSGTEPSSGEPENPVSGESSDPLMTSSLAEFLETWDGKSPIPREPVLYGRVGTAMQPDLVTIGILKPEILFTTLPLTKAQMDKLDEVNIKVMVMPAVKTPEELADRYLDIIRTMEGQLKADSAGRAISGSITEKLNYIASQVPEPKKSFLYVCSLDPLVATGDTWESGVLSLLGGNLAAEGTAYTVTAEELASMDPDVIFYADPLTPEHFTASEAFQGKKAVTSGALVKVDGTALLNQTREIIETVRALAAELYPGVDFTEPLPPSGEESSGESLPDEESSSVPDESSSLPEEGSTEE